MTDRMTRREALEKLEQAQDVVRHMLRMPGVANDIRSCIAALAEPEALTDHVPDATKMVPDDARGATGWWLTEPAPGKRRWSHMAASDDEDYWVMTNADKIRGHTYSPAAALAWVRDGVLPEGQWKEHRR